MKARDLIAANLSRSPLQGPSKEQAASYSIDRRSDQGSGIGEEPTRTKCAAPGGDRGESRIPNYTAYGEGGAYRRDHREPSEAKKTSIDTY
nr:unnamed protein product [Haemonchus contortus]